MTSNPDMSGKAGLSPRRICVGSSGQSYPNFVTSAILKALPAHICSRADVPSPARSGHRV